MAEETCVTNDISLESLPIRTLDELLLWTPAAASGIPSRIPFPEKNAWSESQNQRRTLLCHDMRGGYLSDRFTAGCHVAPHEPYVFCHWSSIHAFIYFSHNFVTIPPTGWTDAAHRNRVAVFGTLITEWDDGKAIWNRMLADENLLKQVAVLLVDIADHYGFEGWLVNVENSIEPKDVGRVIEFLRLLRQRSRTQRNHSQRPLTVIWYDSITIKGDLKWQNSLNSENILLMCRVPVFACEPEVELIRTKLEFGEDVSLVVMKFFHVVDGIFLNYNWTFADLAKAKKTATPFRKYDVFVGVDVFGRGCYGGGGWDTYKALDVLQAHDMSVAMFAPGWVLECNDKTAFQDNQTKFWKLCDRYLPQHKIYELPLMTTFCAGFGRFKFDQGKQDGSPDGDSERCWMNMGEQNIQPCWTANSSQVFKRPDASLPNSAPRFCHDDGWKGGGSLELICPVSATFIEVKLFKCHIFVHAALTVEMTLKMFSESLYRAALVITLRKRTADRKIELLCETDPLAENGVVRPRCNFPTLYPKEIRRTSGVPGAGDWTTFAFDIDEIVTDDTLMEEICFRVYEKKPDNPVRILLGELKVLPVVPCPPVPESGQL